MLHIVIIVATVFCVVGFFFLIFHKKVYGENNAVSAWKTLKGYDVQLEKFDDFFQNIRVHMKHHEVRTLNVVMNRIDKVMMYNVPHGKKFRGMTLVKCFKSFTKNENIDDHSMNQCYTVAWFNEILQASCLIYDDIMDHSQTRRGQPCWYLKNNNGVRAINDATMLRIISFKLIREHLGHHPCYLNILDVVYSILRLTMFGQIVDVLTTPDGKRPDFSLLNTLRYETIVKYKTSYYTFIMPVRIALYLAEISDEKVHSDVESLLLRIGHYFQVQDDYLDIYGNPRVTGKIGTDIADGKCSWIAVQAYKRMNEKQKRIFEDNYGLKHRVPIIEWLFDEVSVKSVYRKFEEEENCLLQERITDFEHKHGVNGVIFRKLLQLLYKRQK